MVSTKVVLDTNVIVSAFGWGGKPRCIFDLCIAGRLELITSSAQIAEIQRVLHYPKFAFSLHQINSIIHIVMEFATLVEVFDNLRVVQDDPSDNVILETAFRGGASYIVTRDEHLLKLKRFQGVIILTAADFLLLNLTPQHQ